MKAERFVSYQDALAWLHSLLRFGQKPGLERMEWMLEQLDHPERTLMFVHVAGTNGKGSTCALLARMLREAGYKVGEFSSPYLTDFRERIRCNGRFISEGELLAIANEVKPLVERCAAETPHGSPTEFEVITLIAILYFSKVARPAVVIWETGLGGRLDSTNVVFPLISVITNIGMDHTDVLGGTLAEIAAEKAGIIKPGVPVVVGELAEEAMQVIARTAERMRSTVYRLQQEFTVEPLSEQLGEQQFRYHSLHRRNPADYKIRLNGEHQLQNAAVALKTVELLREFYSFLLEEEEIERGLWQTSWPGRFEPVSRRPHVILDGAHNAEGMAALARGTAKLAPEPARLHLLVSAMADKPLARMAQQWLPYQDRIASVHVTSFDFPRAATVEQLTDAFRTGGFAAEHVHQAADWRAFLRTWLSEREGSEDDWLVICGSLYFIAHVRSFFPITVEEAGE